jgi:hypothetical protein
MQREKGQQQSPALIEATNSNADRASQMVVTARRSATGWLNGRKGRATNELHG